MRTREHAAARPERLPESERFERKQEVVDAVYALDEPMRTPLTADTRAQMQTALFTVQKNAEKERLPHLTREQKQLLPRQNPLLLLFEDSDNQGTNNVGDRGF